MPEPFIFDGGKVLRCEACGFRMYLGPWDLFDFILWDRDLDYQVPILPERFRPCIPCGGEMVETHVGRADGWEEIEAVGA